MLMLPFCHGPSVSELCHLERQDLDEFTGTKRPKTRWRFTRIAEDWFCFAGLVGRGEAPDGHAIEVFTLPTADAGPDVVPYRSRQPVVLDRQDGAAWLDASWPSQDLLRSSPAGSLQVIESQR
jgi:putative SOS response-associated peptidase YedK